MFVSQKVHELGEKVRALIREFRKPAGECPTNSPDKVALWDEVVYLRGETLRFLKQVDGVLRAREFDIKPADYKRKRRKRKSAETDVDTRDEL